MPQQPVIDLKRLLQPDGQSEPARAKLAFAASLADIYYPNTDSRPAGSAPVTSTDLLPRLAACLRETHLYAYLECEKNSILRTWQGLVHKLARTLPLTSRWPHLAKRKPLLAGTLLLLCCAVGPGVHLWLQTSTGPENYLLRQKLNLAEGSGAESAGSDKSVALPGGRLFPSQAAILSRLADAEDSDVYRRPRNWQISRKIIPPAFASSLPSRYSRPDALAWIGNETAPALASREALAWTEREALTWIGREAPAPRSSLLSLSKEGPRLLTLAGAQMLPQASDFAFSGPSEPYAANQMQRIATGEQAVESLLAEFRDNPDLLRGRFVIWRTVPASDGGYVRFENNMVDDPAAGSVHALGSGPQCRSDRVELASWLGEMRRARLSPGLTAMERASKYSHYVERYSKDYELPPSLVYAIMRTESSFNPNAVSIANALGLMQVVPQTAGGEVYAFLTGKNGTPGREVLFRPESNIQYGTAYLHLLNSRHFKDVKNHISRELCIIAAYNGGPNAVLRSFDRDKAKALAKINRFTPEQLYTTLVRKLPSQETRDYVVKVVEARNKFRHNQTF